MASFNASHSRSAFSRAECGTIGVACCAWIEKLNKMAIVPTRKNHAFIPPPWVFDLGFLFSLTRHQQAMQGKSCLKSFYGDFFAWQQMERETLRPGRKGLFQASFSNSRIIFFNPNENFRLMAKIDSDSEKIFNSWLDFLLPEEMSSKEIEALAQKSKLSAAALKKLKQRYRRGMSTDTFIRLALCRGLSPKSLVSTLLKIENRSVLDQTEIDWILYGLNLNKRKRKEFLDLIKHICKTWNL